MSRLSGEGLNGDNDEAISEQVSNAWRVVGKRLLTKGYDPALVTETMLTVALKSWVGLRTRPNQCLALTVNMVRIVASS